MSLYRWIVAGAVALCALTGMLVWGGVTALAAAPSVGEVWATDVAATSASLNGQINPGGTTTSYHFEYDTSEYTSSAPHGTSAPVPDASAGEGTASVPVSIHPQGLLAATTYYYRLVAHSSVETVYGLNRTFTTQEAASPLALPDGRQWELVSPPNKEGAEVLPIGGGRFGLARGAATQAAENGESMTYGANAPIGQAQGNVLGTQLFSRRGPDGWSTQDITTPRTGPSGAMDGGEYRIFSPDLSSGLVWLPYSAPAPSLAPEVHQETDTNEIYLRNDANGTFRALLTAEPLPNLGNTEELKLQGATPDLSHVVFPSEAALTANAKSGGAKGNNLYEWSGGQLQLVSVLPPGYEASAGVANLGTLRGTDARNAVSADGTRVVFTAETFKTATGESPSFGLFTRDMDTGVTLEVDSTQGGLDSGGKGEYQEASADGTRVFFIDQHQLTADSHEGGPATPYGNLQGPRPGHDLFMFDALDGKLVDLTPDNVDANGAETQSVVGVDEAGTMVYVDARGVLSSAGNALGKTARAGSENLYLLREVPIGSGVWTTTFIATLSETDARSFGGYGGIIGSENIAAGQDPERLTARVTSSGRFFAFMSNESLTGYDNTDVSEQETEEEIAGHVVKTKVHHDEEVYLYDAQENRLVCASCDPTGARPVGVLDSATVEPNMDPAGMWERVAGMLEGVWLAAAIPGWTKISQVYAPYPSRVLSADGRLFFDSVDALVPQDINGREDVYEYEPPGVGSCVRASGCVSLISAGSGSDESSFLDASASGDDVFFTTHDRLVAQDVDSAVDLYDAHVCSTAVPCFPSPPVLPPACTTADSCRAAAPLQPAVFGAPASATFAGTGNLSSSSGGAAVVHGKRKRPHKKARGKKARGHKAGKHVKSGRRRKSMSAGRRGHAG